MGQTGSRDDQGRPIPRLPHSTPFCQGTIINNSSTRLAVWMSIAGQVTFMGSIGPGQYITSARIHKGVLWDCVNLAQRRPRAQCPSGHDLQSRRMGRDGDGQLPPVVRVADLRRGRLWHGVHDFGHLAMGRRGGWSGKARDGGQDAAERRKLRRMVGRGGGSHAGELGSL